MPDLVGGKSLFLAKADAGSMASNTEQGHSASATYRQRDGPSRVLWGMAGVAGNERKVGCGACGVAGYEQSVGSSVERRKRAIGWQQVRGGKARCIGEQ
ncbi:hypothetical protein [Cohnella yongneupensis]|uniref:Uncharacterized protein n=1 Tax=Cohnella yongneupensis TaxID=425006 RepID=A0ABW0R545_9BACL